MGLGTDVWCAIGRPLRRLTFVASTPIRCELSTNYLQIKVHPVGCREDLTTTRSQKNCLGAFVEQPSPNYLLESQIFRPQNTDVESRRVGRIQKRTGIPGSRAKMLWTMSQNKHHAHSVLLYSVPYTTGVSDIKSSNGRTTLKRAHETEGRGSRHKENIEINLGCRQVLPRRILKIESAVSSRKRHDGIESHQVQSKNATRNIYNASLYDIVTLGLEQLTHF